MYDEITLRLRQTVGKERRAQSQGFSDGGLAACHSRNVQLALKLLP